MQVWKEGASGEWIERWYCDLRTLGWWHARDLRFAHKDKGERGMRLLVCGVLRAEAAIARAELAVFSAEDEADGERRPLQLLSRVGLRPAAARGSWWNAPSNLLVLSAELHTLGHRVSCSTLWLSSARQVTPPLPPRVAVMYHITHTLFVAGGYLGALTGYGASVSRLQRGGLGTAVC